MHKFQELSSSNIVESSTADPVILPFYNYQVEKSSRQHGLEDKLYAEANDPTFNEVTCEQQNKDRH